MSTDSLKNNTFFFLSAFVIFSFLATPIVFAAGFDWDFSTDVDYNFPATDIEILAGKAQLKVKDEWELNSWLRRRPISIDNTANASSFTDLQVKVLVTYDSDMQTDFDDIRFTDSDGTTDLNFWLEEKVNEASAVFWVKIPSLSGSSTKTIYIYYDNALATSASNGNNTFIDFDDFETSTADHQFAFGSDSGYMSAFNPVDRRFYFIGAVMDNLTEYNITTWASIDDWGVGYSYPSATLANSSVIWHPTKQKFYIYGGVDKSVSSSAVSSIYSFDPATNVFTLLSETLPQGVVNPGAVYNPADDKVYLFGGRRTFTGGTSTFSNTIYTHNLNLVSPTVTDTTAVLPIASEGMEPLYSDEDGKIYLFGGAYKNGSSLNSLSAILSYNPSSPSTNPVNTGASLPTGRDTMGTAYVDGNVYVFGGYNWTNTTYYNTVYKYDISTNSLTTLGATMPHADDDMKAFYDSVNDKIYVGPVLHSTGSSNEDERKVLILEFDPNTEQFTTEPALGTTPSGWTSTGTSLVDIPRSIGGSLIFSDHSTTTYAAGQKTITALTGVKMVEYKVNIANSFSNMQFYIGPASFNFFTNSASIIRNSRTSSWQLGTGASTNQSIAPILTNSHIIGQLIDVPNSKHYGLVNRASKTSAFNWITNNPPLVTLEINTPSSSGVNGDGSISAAIDWVVVRNTTTGVEPSASVQGEETIYLNTNPSIVPDNSLIFTSISSFLETSTKNDGEIKYQISNDAGVNWYWYNSGWTVTSSGYSEANTATDVNANIASFVTGNGEFLFKAYLSSNGTQLVQLDNIELTYINDTTTPVRSLGSPSGIQPLGTTSVNLELTTDENTTCKYGTTSGVVYASMVNTFSTTGTTAHSQTISGLTNNTSHNYYIRCEDVFGNENTTDYVISFSVAAGGAPSVSTSTGTRSSGSSASPSYLASLGITINTNTLSDDSSPEDLCPSDKILTQNLRAGAYNGRYHWYTKATVKEANILQAHLNRLGFNSGPEDGMLGPISDGAIKRMQIYLGTFADGYVGPITRSLLNTSCGKKGLLQKSVI